MFPDTSSNWEDFPSIIDGIRNPYVHFLGAPGGTIRLIVSGEETVAAGFAISANAVFYWVADEFDVSVTGHGSPSLVYRKGSSYVKRAARSRLLDIYRNDPVLSAHYPGAMHFAFLGGDDCIEFVTNSEPYIEPLRTSAEWTAWVNSACGEVVDSFRAESSL